ncbi:arginase [Nannochloropsis oceanica]
MRSARSLATATAAVSRCTRGLAMVSGPRPLPPTTFSHYVTEPREVAVIGAPLADGQPLLGVDRGPTFIRNRGLVRRLQQDAWVVEDLGDLDFERRSGLQGELADAAHGSQKRAELVGHANHILYEAAHANADQGKLVLALGGDHSIGVGSVAGALKARPETAVIWVDAHADINSPQISETGHLHGMVLSFLMDLDKARAMQGFHWLNEENVPRLLPTRLAYVGLRDVDAGEKAFIRSLGIKAYSMHEVDKHGIGKVMEMVLDHLLDRSERPLHLSFDIDAVDPLYAPSTGTRVAGGLSYREAYYICEEVAHSGCLASMDLVEVNPSLTMAGGDERTVDMAVGLISSALGNSII